MILSSKALGLIGIGQADSAGCLGAGAATALNGSSLIGAGADTVKSLKLVSGNLDQLG